MFKWSIFQSSLSSSSREDASSMKVSRFDDFPEDEFGDIVGYYPFLVVPLNADDQGQRPERPAGTVGWGDHVPESPFVWLETFVADGQAGDRVARPLSGREYQVAVEIYNMGNAPAVGMTVQFLERVEGAHSGCLFSTKRGLQVMDRSKTIVRSERWVPHLPAGPVRVDLAVLVYDVFDMCVTYWDYGPKYDRHLGHHGF
jgi:hypothetical protein